MIGIWPPFSSVRFGDDDDLWVTDYDRTIGDTTAVERVTIFTHEGMPIARLEIRGDPVYRDSAARAPQSRVQSGRDAYRMISQDSLGVARLLVFEIIKEVR